VDGAGLEAISGALDQADFGPAVEWIANLLTASRVIEEVEEASSRISTLVTAIKGHVHLDRSAAMEPVDLERGIEDTLTLLDHKLRAKDVQVSRSYPDSLPAVLGFTGELNQVWTNLIDNAIDAVEPGGHLRIGVVEDRDRVRIEIEDDGPGIPEDIQGQIFDPFFTTKKQGQGTGMGLDIVSQIVIRNQGEIRFTSEPRRTRFVVSLPLAPLGEPPAEDESGDPDSAPP
jgi:signal transduction histidine kinase